MPAMTTSILWYSRGLSQRNRKEKGIKREEAKEEVKTVFQVICVPGKAIIIYTELLELISEFRKVIGFNVNK